MASIAGQGTTFNLPNFTGELFQISPRETPFLSAIGGLNSGQSTETVDFEWQTTDTRSSTANNVVVEGADAPDANNQTRTNYSNVVEIHQRKVEVSYTKLAATQNKAGLNNDRRNPVTDELSFQTQAELAAIAIDVEKSFLSGVYAKPANNNTARQTRGIITAITTNINANGGTARPLTKAIIDSTLKTMFDNNAPLNQDNTVLMVGPGQKMAISAIYGMNPNNTAPSSRTVGGVAIETIYTDLGVFGIMLNRWMPPSQVGIFDLTVCRPHLLRIPGKGHMFLEPLAKTGSSEKYQIYGEIGLEYGPEHFHGMIKDLT